MKRPAAAMDAAAAEPAAAAGPAAAEAAAAAEPAAAEEEFMKLGTVNVLPKLPIVLHTASLVHFL